MNAAKRLSLSMILGIALASAAAFAAAPLQRVTSNAGGVTVAVKPLDLAPGAKSWSFDVSMNTHVSPLEQDLTKVSVLVDASGARHTPIAWKGDPPGGHHREGVLQFAPVSGNPAYVELRIQGVGSPEVRTFRWQLR
jgi:hypothetical protein